MDELKAVATFVRAAELGSFNRAAESQNTTAQAVSKAIRQLEQHLGVRLFHRTTRRVSLTEDGERFLEAVRPGLDGLVGALAAARSAVTEAEGVIRVSAAHTVGRKVLMPLVAEFQRLHPRIRIDLLLENRFTDLVADRIDVGFRAGTEPEAQVVSRRLFRIQQIACAAPAYLREHGVPASLDALLAHRCTGYRQPGTGRPMPWEFMLDGAVVFRPLPAVLCSTDAEVEMQAVVEGVGIGLIDSINATSELRAGRLVPVLADHVSERMGLHLFYPQRADMPGRVRRFIDFMLARLKDDDTFCVPIAELQAMARRFEASTARRDPT